MNIQLSYGREQIPFSLVPSVAIPEYLEPEITVNRESFTGDLLHFLPREKSTYRKVAIVISDKTRLCGYPQYLPWLTEALLVRGADKEPISFYIAYGTHPRQTEEESLNSYGPIYNEYHFVHHDCRDDTLFYNLGTTKRGTPVKIRKDICNSTLLITFGAISHHYFAGFGGGRKLIFPGLGARESIYHNHSLFLDREARSLAAGCQPGNLDGNPLAEDLKEIDTHVPPKISIHGILNASGKVCQLIVGRSYADFLTVCRVYEGYYRFNSPHLYDLVLASSGGYPKDINFIQAHKSVHQAAAFVKDGGKLVMLSECIDMIGSDYFLQYFQPGGFEAAFSILADKYEGNGGTALSMMGKTKRISIYMLTSLTGDICKALNINKITVDEIKAILAIEKGTIAVIRNASILVK